MLRLNTKLRRDSFWSMIGGGIPAIAGLIAIPVMAYCLTVDSFAFTSLLLSLSLFFYVYDLGLTRTMHFYIPKKDYSASLTRQTFLSNAIFISVLTGIVITIAFICFSEPFVVQWLNIKNLPIADAITAIQLTALGIAPALTMNVLKGYLEARQLFKSANLAKLFSGVTLFVFPVVVVLFTQSLSSIGLAFFLSRVASLFVFFYFIFKDVPCSFQKPDKVMIKSILNYGIWAAIAGFFATLFIYGDRFIVAGYINAAELSVYIASQDVLIRYLLIPWSMAIVLVPYFASDEGQQKYLILYNKAQKNIRNYTWLFILVAIGTLYLVMPYLLSQEIITISQKISIILIFGVVFAAFSQLPLIYLYAKGKTKLLSAIFFTEGVLYLILAPIIFSNFEGVGAASLWTLRLLLEWQVLTYFTKKMINNVE